MKEVNVALEALRALTRPPLAKVMSRKAKATARKAIKVLESMLAELAKIKGRE